MDYYFHRGRSAKRPKKLDETPSSGNVLTRWFRDLRELRPARDPKVTLPLGRTQSAAARDRRAKVTRTLSAGHRPRRDATDPNKYQTYNERFVREHTNAPRRSVGNISSDEHVQKLFGVKYGDGNHVYENTTPVVDTPVNKHAKVSYLDEEGLKRRENDVDESVDRRRWSEVIERAETPVQDEAIMPTSSVHLNSKSPQQIIHQPATDRVSPARSPDKNTQSDYSRFEYLKYKHQEQTNNSYHTTTQHEYENLPPEGVPKRWEDEDDVPARDPASLKSIRYGPGHEKFPSWPGSSPGPTDKPHRSHSWTQQTSYPKERPAGYARPAPKRANPSYTQQLKTVVERCEKMAEGRRYLPRVDREGNTLGDQDYMAPSPPERDKPPLTQTDLEKYCHASHFPKMGHGDYASPYEDLPRSHHLTQADLEEYSRHEDTLNSLKPMHQHQGSYAQSEGYHSYVSSSEITTTPFLDRLRQENEAQNQQRWEEETQPEGRRQRWEDHESRGSQDRGQQWGDHEVRGLQDRNQQWGEQERLQHWEDDGRPGRDSVVTTSSGSVSSSETLKCHGSMSDVSVASSSCRSKQQIAHSARVAQPQRHHSESVLYLGKSDRSQQLKLFPVSTYTMQPSDTTKPVISPTSQPQLSVAERISELERQQQQQRFIYLDPDKRCRVPDPTLKAIQKKALLSFYERHQHSSGPGLPAVKPKESWKSEPQLAQREPPSQAGAPPPPPRPLLSPGDMGTSWGKSQMHHHSSSMSSLHAAVIVGSPISIDDWVPERPPKKSHLRPTPSPVEVPAAAPAPERASSPDLPPPPPPPPPPAEEEVPFADEPLPPPPEAEWLLATAVPRRSTPGPASPREDPPLSHVQGTFGSPSDKDQVLGMVVHSDEIQYDPDAINAIMECNRGVKDLQRRRLRKPREELLSPRSHIENRPPLPLPRDAPQPSALKPNCDLDDFAWLSQYEKARKQKKTLAQALECAPSNPFVRGNKDASVRASIKLLKNEMVSRMSLRFPREKQRADTEGRAIQRGLAPSETISAMQRSVSVTDTSVQRVSVPSMIQRSVSVSERAGSGDSDAVTLNQSEFISNNSEPPPVGPKLTRLSASEERLRAMSAVKKVSDYESKIPVRDKGPVLSVFGRRMSEELPSDDTPPALPPQRSNSKAAYLAVRREKELGINNYEGSYKLTMSPSGESIEPRSPLEKPPMQLEMLKLKEKSTENLVLDNRLPLEPPDLIPKISGLNRKTSSVQDVSESPPEYDYTRNSYERYRLLPTAFNPRLVSARLGFTDITSISEDKVETDITRNSISSVSAKSESELLERLTEHPEVRRVHISTEEETEEKPHLKEPVVTPVPTTPKSPEERKIERSPPLDERGDFSPPDVTRTKRLVERSTSFGRGDSMILVDLEVEADVDGEEDTGIALSDAASQTDLADEHEEPEEPEEPEDRPDPRHVEDLEVERLSRDLASQLSPSDKLLTLLVPASERKRPTDYVAGLFRLDAASRRRQPRKHKTGSSCSNVSSSSSASSTSSSASSSSDQSPHHTIQQDLNKPEPVAPLPSSSPYFSTSESKARLLARYPSGVDSLPLKDSEELKQKKEELMQRLDKKLEILRAEQVSLGEEAGLNDELGTAVAALVARVARPHEASKYRLHVEEVGKITSLLLGLSGRLARAENALLGLPENHSERKIHEDKRDKLQEQLVEAKLLKESIDRRSEAVCKTLGKYLREEDLADYLHFIHMKEKLIVDAREVADKIALGEEQLAALSEPRGAWP